MGPGNLQRREWGWVVSDRPVMLLPMARQIISTPMRWYVQMGEKGKQRKEKKRSEEMGISVMMVRGGASWA